MPYYFFHTVDGGADIDRTGVRLRDDAAARTEAIRFGGAVINDEPEMLWGGKDFQVQVTNKAGRLFFTVVMVVVDAPDLRAH